MVPGTASHLPHNMMLLKNNKIARATQYQQPYQHNGRDSAFCGGHDRCPLMTARVKVARGKEERVPWVKDLALFRIERRSHRLDLIA